MFKRQNFIYASVFLGAVLVTVAVMMLLFNIDNRQAEGRQAPVRAVEIADDELDPAVWGQNYPFHYDRFMMTATDYGPTAFGGSTLINKLEVNPDLVRLWSGYAFSVDFNEERGHYYALIDQKETKRQEVVKQPAACANCHAAEAPQLIAEMGWEAFNHTPYSEMADKLHLGTSCADCHDPQTMELRITRPAFVNAMAQRGIDVTQASRQEMRSYVCGQCHVEYYFAGENKLLTFPWSNGLNIDDIVDYYDEVGHIDWKHKETGGGLLKAQHPEFELYSTSVHASSGVACADCHMPYTRVGGIKMSDHWIRSPLTNLNNACQTCHNIPEEDLQARVSTIQGRTATLLETTERAISDAIDAINAAKAAGVTDEQLVEVFKLHRHAQMRWDFISSENSTGFHSPQESARVLADAINLARQAQMGAVVLQNSLAQTTRLSQ